MIGVVILTYCSTIIQMIYFFKDAPKDTLRLGENQVAEVYFNNQWTPICGHWFWNNNIGATLFCQELGYNSGVITKKHGNFCCWASNSNGLAL